MNLMCSEFRVGNFSVISGALKRPLRNDRSGHFLVREVLMPSGIAAPEPDQPADVPSQQVAVFPTLCRVGSQSTR